MAKIHFLNVGRGDCTIIEGQTSGRTTMIDICCGNMKPKGVWERLATFEDKPRGNYNMCSKPTNPIDYLNDRGICNIWRFILTHPDMDHMDGIKRLFNQKTIVNYWDSGIRKEKPDFNGNSHYLEEDWDFYDDLINGRVENCKIIKPMAGDKNKYWNMDDDGGNGDYLYIVSPENIVYDDINDASYVIVYRSAAGSIIFSGDSSEKTWEYILDDEDYKDLVSNASVLFAPHHGRKFDDYSYLNTVNPLISFLGCAESKHLAYDAWRNRDLLFFTNNQCGNIHIYPYNGRVVVFIENHKYAIDYTKGNSYQHDGYWFLCSIDV